MTVDLVIRGGTVYDGTGSEGFVADVAVAGGRVVQIGAVDAPDAPSLDAAGLAVAPGFIDIHSRPASGQRPLPGRHHRGGRELRLRLLPDP